MKEGEAVTLSALVQILGNGVTLDNLRGRIRRGTLVGFQNERGEWYVTPDEVRRIVETVEPCQCCSRPATSLVIVKRHHHSREEFTLCPACAAQAQAAYGRQGGVLEIAVFPLQGEGWRQL